jgi:hypothetical protein
MRNSNPRPTARLVIFGACCCALFIPLLSKAHTQTATINIVNNSSREIRHVYLSHVNADDWSADQISSAIQPGQSQTLNNVSCDEQEVKVIGEDQDGCFLTGVVACGTATWTISNDTAVDCGGK